MLFLDDIKNITKECELYKYIEKTSQNLKKSIEVQHAKKKNLTQILDEIANTKIDEVNLDDTKNLLSMIEEIKNVLDRINDNIDDARKLQEEINNIIVRIDSVISNKINDEPLSKDINYFYMLYIEKANSIEETNLVYESINLKACKYIFSAIPSSDKKDGEIINNIKENCTGDNQESELEQSTDSQIFKEFKIGITKLEDKEEKNSDKLDEKLEEKKSNKNEKVKKLKENNTLKISETQNKVFLPYKIYELEDKLRRNPDKYKSIEDVINSEYIIPLDKYKNATFSRFKEAYNLMRAKEKSTFSKALDLAFEVTFKNNLNPAIITACKDLHQLDTYLDCLEKNNVENFRCFNIEYEVLPTTKK